VVVNWAGGFHHGKKTEASGFCYINDIVLCILELLKIYPRVLYLDIDVHHGDGVEEAFYHTNRVMTVSFHEFSEGFFPETGSLSSVGEGIGKYYTVNVPLKKGIDDITYLNLFRQIMQTIMSCYRPDALVIQCGADSLSKDKLGHLNLSIKGHAEAINYMKSFGVPMILLGGGGYTIENVSRCWAYETGMVLKQEIDNQIPSNDPFYSFYETENYKIHFDVKKEENQNDNAYLNNIIETITENLR
jgi:histone deacetylase 1/2